jgi:hypothetical protein
MLEGGSVGTGAELEESELLEDGASRRWLAPGRALAVTAGILVSPGARVEVGQRKPTQHPSHEGSVAHCSEDARCRPFCLTHQANATVFILTDCAPLAQGPADIYREYGYVQVRTKVICVPWGRNCGLDPSGGQVKHSALSGCRA